MGARQMTQPNFQHSFSMPLVTATAAAGAATANGKLVRVTSESISTAAAGEYTLTLTNSAIGVNSTVLCSTGLGSSTTGTPGIGGVTVANGSVVVTVTNLHASAAFNGTVTVDLLVINPV